MASSVLPADSFIVINKTILNNNDKDLLVMLYQPIIGFPSISLYFTLWSYLNKTDIMSKEYSHYNLLLNMKANIIEINEAKEKLEALGLIRTYLKKGEKNCYIYELYSPLNANEFFNNPILSTLLYSNLGKESYDDSLAYFEIPTINLNEYKNVSKKLHEVFEVGSLNGIEYNNLRKASKSIITITPKIDLNTVLEIIPNEILNKRSLTNEMKDMITNLSFVYDFNDEELRQILSRSVSSKKTIDIEKLKQNAMDTYRYEHNGRLPNLIYKNQPEYLKSESYGSSNKDKVLYQFETMSPHDFLASKYKGVAPTKTDLKIVEYLLVELKLTPAVVNVLIDYVLKINNNKLTRSFVETIAGQWKRENIKTAIEAMELAKKERSTKKVVKKEVIKSKVPTWVDKEIGSENSIEKQKELEEMLKEYR